MLIVGDLAKMNKKRILIVSTTFMTLIGLIGLSQVFVKSLAVNAKAENNAWLEIDVSNMKPGDVKKVDHSYLVYRLPIKEIIGDTEFVIFNGWAPTRLCEISIILPGERSYNSGPRKPYENQVHYSDQCDWGVWNLNGKYVDGTGTPNEKNLVKIKFEVTKHGKLLMHRARI